MSQNQTPKPSTQPGTAITQLPGMGNVQVIQASPQLIKENSDKPSVKK